MGENIDMEEKGGSFRCGEAHQRLAGGIGAMWLERRGQVQMGLCGGVMVLLSGHGCVVAPSQCPGVAAMARRATLRPRQ
jgi:hypothetical protein